jgi:glycerol kinase
VTETTALGVAYLAGLAVGYWKSIESIAKQWQVERVFKPKMPLSQVDEMRSRWNAALQRSKDWEVHAPTQGKRKSGNK